MMMSLIKKNQRMLFELKLRKFWRNVKKCFLNTILMDNIIFGFLSQLDFHEVEALRYTTILEKF